MTFDIRVSNHWLTEYGTPADLKWTTTTRGSGTLSWRMDPMLHQPAALAPDAQVRVRVNGVAWWGGRLEEPGKDGTYTATGLWSEAENTTSRDGAGDPTVDLDAAIDAAIARGSVSWSRPVSIATTWGDHDPDPGMTLLALADGVVGDFGGSRWQVGSTGVVVAYPAKPAPRWQIIRPGLRYGSAADGLVTHLTGQYLSALATFSETTIEAGISARRREQWVDLADHGILTEASAKALLADMVTDRGMDGLALSQPIAIGPYDLQTIGGAPAEAWQIRGGDGLRIWGAGNGYSAAGYLDVVAAECAYTVADDVTVVTPTAYAPRGFKGRLAQTIGA